MASTLRFSSNDERTEFHFNSEDLRRLYLNTQLDFLLSSKFYVVKVKDLDCLDYGGHEMNLIRQKYLKCSLYKSLSNVSNYHKLINMLSESGGKSGSFVFITTDQKFVIKTINKAEFSTFKEKLSHNYTQRILNKEKTFLVRIFALLNLRKLDQYVIIMENLIYNKDNSIIFDLKGSKVGRFVKDIPDPLDLPKGVTLKDINFEESNFKINLNSDVRDSIIEVLIEDFKILRDCGIMDYSLLLVIKKGKLSQEESRLSFVDLNDYVVTIGIIDLLQEYNISKQGEKVVKSLFNDVNGVSSIDPKGYFDRISKYLARIFN